MTKKKVCIERTSPKKTGTGTNYKKLVAVPNYNRMLKYKMLAAAFSYPDDSLFTYFPEFKRKREDIILEYDRLFRAKENWLYSAEYTQENEFQRAAKLSDINGFYRAFGLETDRERPDSLSCELEFMHYLILKMMKAPDRDKASICLAAQKKFFSEHLYLALNKIAKNILSNVEDGFYRELALSALEFMKSERSFLREIKCEELS